MGGGRRKRETTEIKTRELLASPLVSPSLSLVPSAYLPLFHPSPFSPAPFLPLSRYVSATETKKCNLPLLGDTTLPRALNPPPLSASSLSLPPREKRVTSAELAILRPRRRPSSSFSLSSFRRERTYNRITSAGSGRGITSSRA